MLKKLGLFSTVLMVLLSPAASYAAPPEPSGIPDPLHLVGVTAEPGIHKGRAALRIELSDEEQVAQLAGAGGNRPTFAVFDLAFTNGVIEVDVAADINGRGGPDARGFAGIAFHLSEDSETFEAVYLRMANGLANDPLPPAPRSERAIQYIAHPGFHFAESRAERPGHYEKAAAVGLGTWHRLRLEISGTQLRALVDGREVLLIEDMRRPGKMGRVALWVGDGTEAHFSNLTIFASGS